MKQASCVRSLRLHKSLPAQPPLRHGRSSAPRATRSHRSAPLDHSGAGTGSLCGFLPPRPKMGCSDAYNSKCCHRPSCVLSWWRRCSGRSRCWLSSNVFILVRLQGCWPSTLISFRDSLWVRLWQNDVHCRCFLKQIPSEEAVFVLFFLQIPLCKCYFRHIKLAKTQSTAESAWLRSLQSTLLNEPPTLEITCSESIQV